MGLAFTASADAPWLRVTPAAVVMPAAVQIGVDISGLDPGIYNSTVTINAPASAPSVRTIAVQLTVTPGGSPHLDVDSRQLTYSLTEGAAPATTRLSVMNSGSGALDFTATAATASGRNWLAVSPSAGNAKGGAPAAVDVTINLSNLSAGTYTGTVTIASAATNEGIVIPVNLAVGRPQQALLLSQVGLTFTAVQGGGRPLPQEVQVLNAGQGAMTWKATAIALSSGANWLAVTPDTGSVETPFTDLAALTVTVDPSTLQPGTYYGQIQVTAPGADNSPQSVTVMLNLLPRGSNPSPDVRPTGLVFNGAAEPAPVRKLFPSPTWAPSRSPTTPAGRF